MKRFRCAGMNTGTNRLTRRQFIRSVGATVASGALLPTLAIRAQEQADFTTRHLGDLYMFRTPDLPLPDFERFVRLDTQPQAEVGTGKFGAPAIQLIT